MAKIGEVKGETHRETVKKYDISKLNVEGISFPTPIHQIPKFEAQNNVTINLYITESEGTSIRPIKISKREQSSPINLLMIVDRDTGKIYFCTLCSYLIFRSFPLHLDKISGQIAKQERIT